MQSQTANRRVKIKIFVSLWLLLKGQSGEILLEMNTSIIQERFEEHFFDLPSLKFWLRIVMHTTESNFFNFVIEYLSEIKIEFENTLACLSGAHTGSNDEKNGGWKSRDILPSITQFFSVPSKLWLTITHVFYRYWFCKCKASWGWLSTQLCISGEVRLGVIDEYLVSQLRLG